jgi:Tol biopolymer transport system component
MLAAAFGVLAVGAIAWLAATTFPPTTTRRYDIRPVAFEGHAATAPAWSPDGRILAYSQESGGYYQIFTRRVDQGAASAARLTSLDADCLRPFWHPSGDRLYFRARNALWSVGAAGGQPEPIVPDVLAAAIAPDGRTRHLFVPAAGLADLDDGGTVT